jgi:hypothetical protein
MTFGSLFVGIGGLDERSDQEATGLGKCGGTVVRRAYRTLTGSRDGSMRTEILLIDICEHGAAD